MEDDPDNTTRFVVLSREAVAVPDPQAPTMTSLFFCVRNIPSALCKALGGFAGNAVNLTKGVRHGVGGAWIEEKNPAVMRLPHTPLIAIA